MEEEIDVVLDINFRYNKNSPNEQLNYIVDGISEYIEHWTVNNGQFFIDSVDKIKGRNYIEIESIIEKINIDKKLGLSLKLFDTILMNCLQCQDEDGLQLLRFMDDNFILILTERQFFRGHDKKIKLQLSFELNFYEEYLTRFKELSGQPS